MGVDLVLYPYHTSKWPEKGPLAHMPDRAIYFPRWSAIYEFIDAAKPKPIPRRAFIVEEYAGEDAEVPVCHQEAGMGGWLSYLQAGKLRKSIASASRIAEAYPSDWKKLVMPVLKKLARLKPSTPVILDWT